MEKLASSLNEAPLENSILSIKESGSGNSSTDIMLRQVLQAIQTLQDNMLKFMESRQEGNVSDCRVSNTRKNMHVPRGRGVSTNPAAGTAPT